MLYQKVEKRSVKSGYCITQELADAFKEEAKLQKSSMNDLLNRYLAEGIERDRREQSADILAKEFARQEKRAKNKKQKRAQEEEEIEYVL